MFAEHSRPLEQHPLGPNPPSQPAAEGVRGLVASRNDAAGLPLVDMPPCECPEWCPLDHDNE